MSSLQDMESIDAMTQGIKSVEEDCTMENIHCSYLRLLIITSSCRRLRGIIASFSISSIRIRRRRVRSASGVSTSTHGNILLLTSGRLTHRNTLRQHTLIDPQIHQRRHRFHVLLVEQIVEAADVDEVDEARVELAVAAELPEGEPVLPVEVGVAAEHLLVHVLDLRIEALREAGALAAPLIWIVLVIFDLWERWGGREVIGWEKRLVLDLAVHPGLDVFDVGRSWEVDWVPFRVDPGVRGPVEASKRVYPERQWKSQNLRSRGHSWAALLTAGWTSRATVFLLHAFEHAAQQAVLFDD